MKPIRVTPEVEALIRASVAADVLQLAEAAYWRRRAEHFEWAKPKLGETYGNRTADDLSAAWRKCDSTARACRAKAALLETGGESWDLAPTQRAS